MCLMKAFWYRFLNESAIGSAIIALLISLSILGFFLETEYVDSVFLRRSGIIIAGIFGIEYIARIWTANLSPQPDARRKYIFSFAGLIDLVAFLPALLLPAASGSVVLRLIRIFRLIQLLKIKSISTGLGRMASAIRHSWNELLASFLISISLIMVGAVLMYFVEGSAQPETFGSVPRALWWSMATLTTVGYGDAYPITVLGKITASLIAIVGISAVAIPAGIFAAAFHKVGIEN